MNVAKFGLNYMKIGKPFKSASLGKITQGYSEQHKALDLSCKYGEWLVAPFNCKIERIKIAMIFEKETMSELEQGYGLLMKSTEDPTITCSYWHTMPFFPVREEMIVLRGEPIAQGGNSGFVLSNGQYVPLKDRTKFPHSGTHLHWSMPEDWTNKIEWDKEIKFDLLMAVYLTFLSITNFFKKNDNRTN